MTVTTLHHSDTGTARDIARLHAACIPTGFLSSLGERFLARLYRAIAADEGSVVCVAGVRMSEAGCQRAEVGGRRSDPRAAVSRQEERGDLSEVGDQRSDIRHWTSEIASARRTAAFLAGTTDTAAMYRRILRRHWPGFFVTLLPRAFSPRTLRAILQTMRYGRRRAQRPAVSRQVSGRRSEVRGLSQSPISSQQTTLCTAELLAIAVSPESRGRGVGSELVRAFEHWLAHDTRPATHDSYTVATAADDPVSNGFYRACGFTEAGEFEHHGNRMKVYERQSFSTDECE